MTQHEKIEALKDETIDLLRDALQSYKGRSESIDPKLIKEIRDTVDSWLGDGSSIPMAMLPLAEAKKAPFRPTTAAAR